MEETTQQVTTVATNTPEVVQQTTTTTPPVRTEAPQRVFEKKKVIFRTYQIIWYILGVVEVMLAFRVALKALGANPVSGFVSLIYTLTDPLAIPFQGIFRMTVSGGSVFEWTTLIAALVYALVAYGLVTMMQFMKPVTPHEVANSVDNP